MENLLTIAIGAILVNNIVLTRFLGLCPFFGVSTRLRNASMMGFAVIFVMTASSIITWAIYQYLLIPLNMEYMRLVVFILVIASFVQLTAIFVRKHSQRLHRAFGIYLPLITTNCAILAVVLINTMVKEYSLLETIVNSVATGVGFLLALVLMAGIRERLDLADPPGAFRGLPIAFVSAALLALAFQGFGGMLL
ncbi:MAG: RnfABCDGE type electron transport complex subunit A [Hadesarchaea archaeon]|nr:RnfABCDGE type electron transport complex subunit A [Hadesarchaea archaeon]